MEESAPNSSCPPSGDPRTRSRSRIVASSHAFVPRQKPVFRMTADSSRSSSAFQKYTLGLQKMKAKGGMLRLGVGLTVGGIILFPVMLLMSAVLTNSGEMKGLTAMIWLVGLVVSIAAFFGGLWLTAKAIFSKSRTVTCPFCEKRHSLFSTVRSYICDECMHVLRLSKPGNELVKVECPYCALEWADSPDAGNSRCFCCGARLSLNGGFASFAGETLTCPNCAATNANGSYFCKSCGDGIEIMEPLAAPTSTMGGNSVAVVPDGQGMDWISVRAAPPIGLLYRATSRLRDIITQANALPDPTPPPFKLFSTLEGILGEMEEAVRRFPESAVHLRELLCSVTGIVARLLKGLEFPPMDPSSLQTWKESFKELPALFNGLAERVNSAIDPSLRVAEWPQELVKLKRGTAFDGTNPKPVLVNRTELTNWVAKNLPDGPLTPPRAPQRLRPPGGLT